MAQTHGYSKRDSEICNSEPKRLPSFCGIQRDTWCVYRRANLRQKRMGDKKPKNILLTILMTRLCAVCGV